MAKDYGITWYRIQNAKIFASGSLNAKLTSIFTDWMIRQVQSKDLAVELGDYLIREWV